MTATVKPPGFLGECLSVNTAGPSVSDVEGIISFYASAGGRI